MKPLSRKSVGKGRSAHSFNRNTRRTRGANVVPVPMRGGWRL